MIPLQRLIAVRSLRPTRCFVLAFVALAACASSRPAGPAAPPSAGTPGADAPAPALPAIPARDGVLAIDVVYPDSGQRVVTDSTFIFGSVGSGSARLTINAVPVDVAPNGAFLAFLAVPADGVYRLQATKDGASASAERVVATSTDSAPLVAGARIVEGSAYPSGAHAVAPDQPIEVGFRGTRGGHAHLVLPGGTRIVLHEVAGVRDDGDRNFVTQPGASGSRPAPWSLYQGVMKPAPLAVADTGVATPALGSGVPFDMTPAHFELVVGRDTVRTPLPLNLRLLDPVLPRVGVVTAPIDARSDWDVRARPYTSGPFHWFWPHGTMLELVEERDGMLRARLTETLSAWVPAGDVRILPPGTPAPFSTIAGVRLVHHHDAIDVRIPLAEPLPFRVDEDGSTLTIDVYGAKSTSNFFQYGSLDPLVARAEWSQPDDDVYRVTLHLTQPMWGYTAFRAQNGDLVVRIRRPPVIDEDNPLRGLRIAVDAGHPPAGATGPTRLSEAEANLAIAQALEPMLERAGAHVIMVRRDAQPVPLGDRPQMAADSNAHILVSIHNNAFPDGVNPFENNGTSAYYYHPHSADLAQHLQRELLAELHLRDIGIGRADLALARPTWMPAVLTETMFLMLPRQEAALRNPEVHQRIAAAHLRALEAFARERARYQR